jgi:hypothetical protein
MEKGGNDMAKQSEKTAKCEKIWLLYFNQYLFEEGVINEEERNRMKLQIELRKPLPASR